MSWKKKIVMPALLGLSMTGVVVLALVGNQGCTAKMPAATTFVATATPTVPPNVIDNMEDGDTYLNPAMCGTTSSGVPTGFWVASTWGDPSNLVNGAAGAAVIFCGGVGCPVSPSCAIHLYGNIKDNNDGQYPSFQLEGKLRGGNYFDGLQYGYTGVRFYLKTGVGDNCPYRRFNVPVGGTTPPAGGGYCATNCYGHFGTSLSATNGAWQQKTFPFTSLTRAFGNPLTPPTLTGKNLQELLEVQWQFGRNGSAGTSYVDYWIDQVEFF